MAADWLDLDPAPIDLDVTPTYGTTLAERQLAPIYLYVVDDARGVDLPEPSTAFYYGPWDERDEQDAERDRHYPWCGVHDNPVGQCTDDCLL